MSSSTEVQVNQNGFESDLPPKRSDSFEETSKFITQIMPQKTFDKVCMVLAEILGTASLLFFGCAGTLHWDGPPFSLRPPLNFGLTVMMIIQIFGHVSFAILNPAVTICAVVNNLFSIKMGFVLIIAQILGSILGFGLLRFLTPEDIFWADENGTCMTLVHPSVSITQAFFVEFFLTSALISMVSGVWDPRNRNNGDSAPLRIGFAIVALSIAGGPFTDASMNPVRSLGPAFWNWKWENHWLYWIAPMSAGFLASVFYRIVFWRQNPLNELPDEVSLTRLQKTEL